MAFSRKSVFIAIVVTGAILIPSVHLLGHLVVIQEADPRPEPLQIPPTDVGVTSSEDATKAATEVVRKAIGLIPVGSLDAETSASFERDAALLLAAIMHPDFETYHSHMQACSFILGPAATGTVAEEFTIGDYEADTLETLKLDSLANQVKHLWQNPLIRDSSWKAINTTEVMAQFGYNALELPRHDVPISGRLSIYTDKDGKYSRQHLAQEDKIPVVMIRFAAEFTTGARVWIDFIFVHQADESVEGGRWSPLWVVYSMPANGKFPRFLL